MLKSLCWSIRSKISQKRLIHADGIYRISGYEYLKAEERLEASDFILLYLGVFAAGTFILCACGFGIGDSMFEFASALGTVGLSVGITGYDASPVVLWTETVGMLAGRLEIYVIFVAAVQFGREIKDGYKETEGR